MGCGGTQVSGPSADASGDNSHLPSPDASVVPDAPPACEQPGMPAGAEVELAPEFASYYRVYQLGAVPGVPNPLGGVVVARGPDTNTLLVAGASERSDGGLYSIRVRRSCGHIVAFEGVSTRVADGPYIDANLIYGPQDLLLFSEWPQFTLAQLPAGMSTPARSTDLRPLGIVTADDSGPGGIGFVPPGLSAAGELRAVTWPGGHWYHVGATLVNGLFTIDSLTEGAQIPNNPGGFAYVPAGSQGFPRQSIMVAEWNQSDSTKDRVAAYEANELGDPAPPTRREFFTRFPRPWGAYFEPVTGDYLFLTWGDGDDRVYIVQGFVPPPS